MAKAKKSPVAKQVVSSEEKSSKLLEDFQGFKILPVVVDSAKSVRHYFYMRKHESKAIVDEDIKDRTLFLLNLPADTTDRHIRKLFKGHAIEQITYKDFGSSAAEEYHKRAVNDETKENNKHVRELRKLFTCGSSAHVVFTTEEDLSSVLNMRRVEKKWASDDSTEQPLGFERYVLAYDLSRPNAAELQQEVDSYMMKFKADEYQKEREKLERMNQMDDDGFTTVVRHKKTKASDGTIHVGSITAEAAEAQKVHQAKKKKELVNFYRFQMREKKQNELVDLRRRFEEDKAKIAQLKQTRKFKPY
ncbi:hypothetical protein INT47_000421 [Mucor saturninus]|uniref:Uncharacterized protein n=1 Tax=Mucor saturninus TaxID=64648 RepID=A0A8H7UR41_9FUNG|nr:hypothetical protein INT47_000421 [Mucor saturninus]